MTTSQRSTLLPLVAFLSTLVLGVTGAGADVVADATSISAGDDPYEIVFDATGGRTILQAPSKPREFDSEEALIAFLQQELNAEVLYDSTGALVGFRGTAVMLDEPCTLDGSTCTPVASAIATYLGGTAGYFLFKGEVFCVDPALCEGSAPLAAGLRMAAATASEYSIQASSFAQGSIFREVGTQTKQGGGGYDRSGYDCDGIGWLKFCWGETGWNKLTTESFLTEADGNVAQAPGPVSCGNCRKIRQSAWGLLMVARQPVEQPWTIHGAYGWHSGEGTSGSMSAETCTLTGCIYGP